MADERPVAAAAPEAVVVPLPVGVYHVTLVGGDDSSAAAAVVGVAAATPTNATCTLCLKKNKTLNSCP